jgi:hypothetical protein
MRPIARRSEIASGVTVAIGDMACGPALEGGLEPWDRGHGIASYQYKDPFGVLEMDSSGAFCHSWWALEDLNL